METLIEKVKACVLCKDFLPNAPKPIFQVGAKAGILIIGQAPGRKAHESGIPWNDASGNRLRNWLGVGRETFYNPDIFALMPMGFCYPGTGSGGDLPPRPECAPTWHYSLRAFMPNIKLTLLIGHYAQKYYLRENSKPTLSETVGSFKEYESGVFPTPHPSPRNLRWLKNNPWFEQDIVPIIGIRVRQIIGGE